MIAKGKAIAHGGNAIRYALREGKLGQILATNLLGSLDADGILSEFEMVNRYNERCRNKYLRFEIGIAPQDEKNLTHEDKLKIVSLFARNMNLSGHQWLACTHKDTDNLHIHLIANRIALDSSVYDTTFMSNRSARTAEEISREMGLTIANDVRRQKENLKSHTDPARQSAKERLQRIAYGELGKGHPNIDSFLSSLWRQGVSTEPVKDKQGKMYGLRLGYSGQTFKASEIGREFGYRSLLNQFGITAQGQKGVSRVPRYSQERQGPTYPASLRQTSAMREQPHAHSSNLATEALKSATGIVDALLSVTTPESHYDQTLADWYEEQKRKKKKKKKRGYGIR